MTATVRAGQAGGGDTGRGDGYRGVRGAATAARQTTTAAAMLHISPDRPAVVASAKSIAVRTPTRVTGTDAACAAATISRASSAPSQTAAATANGAVARGSTRRGTGRCRASAPRPDRG